MGFRTVVVLINDLADNWEKDEKLGKKIMRNATFKPGDDFEYGKVVECAHADGQTLGVFDSYGFHPLAHSIWTRDEQIEDTKIKLLRQAAEALGFRLVRKTKKNQGE